MDTSVQPTRRTRRRHRQHGPVVDPSELAARQARFGVVVVPLWKAARRWTAAFVLAAFPFLFILDVQVETRLSPVLPGLVALLLVLLIVPFLLVEVSSRRLRRLDPERQVHQAARALQSANAAVGVAALWLVLWFAVGT